MRGLLHMAERFFLRRLQNFDGDSVYRSSGTEITELDTAGYPEHLIFWEKEAL